MKNDPKQKFLKTQTSRNKITRKVQRYPCFLQSPHSQVYRMSIEALPFKPRKKQLRTKGWMKRFLNSNKNSEKSRDDRNRVILISPQIPSEGVGEWMSTFKLVVFEKNNIRQTEIRNFAWKVWKGTFSVVHQFHILRAIKWALHGCNKTSSLWGTPFSRRTQKTFKNQTTRREISLEKHDMGQL